MSEHGKLQNDFDVAKSLTAILQPLEKQQQERVLRWVTESLGIQNVTVSSNPKTTPANLSVQENQTTQNPQHSDIRSFVDSKNPLSDVQLTTVVAYFLRFCGPQSDRKETLNAKTLEEAIRRAGRSQPKHHRMALTNAKNQGYLDPAGNKGEYRINSVGENLVTMTLGSGNGAQVASNRTARKSQKRVKKKSK